MADQNQQPPADPVPPAVGGAHVAVPNRLIVRQPSDYKFGTDFPSWYRQFWNYCTYVAVAQAVRFQLLLSFLDINAFNIVENLGFEEDEKLNLQNCYERIKNALKQTKDRLLPRFSLHHRKQKKDETMEQYALELQKIAAQAYPDDQNIRNNGDLIECFITGLTDDGLSIKLLQNRPDFNTLTDALEAANNYLSAIQTRKAVSNNTGIYHRLT